MEGRKSIVEELRSDMEFKELILAYLHRSMSYLSHEYLIYGYWNTVSGNRKVNGVVRISLLRIW